MNKQSFERAKEIEENVKFLFKLIDMINNNNKFFEELLKPISSDSNFFKNIKSYENGLQDDVSIMFNLITDKIKELEKEFEEL